MFFIDYDRPNFVRADQIRTLNSVTSLYYIIDGEWISQFDRDQLMIVKLERSHLSD